MRGLFVAVAPLSPDELISSDKDPFFAQPLTSLVSDSLSPLISSIRGLFFNELLDDDEVLVFLLNDFLAGDSASLSPLPDVVEIVLSESESDV